MLCYNGGPADRQKHDPQPLELHASRENPTPRGTPCTWQGAVPKKRPRTTYTKPTKTSTASSMPSCQEPPAPSPRKEAGERGQSPCLEPQDLAEPAGEHRVTRRSPKPNPTPQANRRPTTHRPARAPPLTRPHGLPGPNAGTARPRPKHRSARPAHRDLAPLPPLPCKRSPDGRPPTRRAAPFNASKSRLQGSTAERMRKLSRRAHRACDRSRPCTPRSRPRVPTLSPQRDVEQAAPPEDGRSRKLGSRGPATPACRRQ